jgi:myosin heavy subunit
MAQRFELDLWVWMPDPREHSRPARVVESPFMAGQAGVVETEDGMTHTIDAEDTPDLMLCELLVLSPEVDNMIKFRDLNEHAVLHNLRIRYREEIIYTNVAGILICVNPFKKIENLYSAEELTMYKVPKHIKDVKKLPPHIFQIASMAYHQALKKWQNQSCIISGESGAGKTEATKQILNFLAEASRGSGKDASGPSRERGLLEKQVMQANPVMEAFGNAKTVHNDNSSRFGKLVTVHISKNGTIGGASILTYLLEKSRVVCQTKDERNYHIFYQVIQGALADPALQKTLGTGEVEDYICLYQDMDQVTSIQGVNDADNFEDTWTAMETLGIGAKAQTSIFHTLVGILQLSNAEFEPNNGADGTEASKLKYKDPIKTAANLLGLKFAVLEGNLISHELDTNRQSVYAVKHNVQQAIDAKEALAKAIYARIFDWLLVKINASLGAKESPGDGAVTFQEFVNIGVLDIFGFEVFEKNSFEQFCINYCNEKLQQHFAQHVFVMELEEYRAEGVDVPDIDFSDNSACVDLIEAADQGLLMMLNEEIRLPKGSDAGFLTKVYNTHAKHACVARPPRAMENARESFVVRHYAAEVVYNTTGWLEKNKDMLLDNMTKMLRESNMPFMKELMALNNLDDDGAGAGGAPRRRTSASRRPTLSTQFKNQLKSLMITLDKSDAHFARCLKPNAEKKPGMFDARNVIRQLRYAGIVEVCKIRQQGYPTHFEEKAFLTRYRPLQPIKQRKPLTGDVATDCQELVVYLQASAGLLTFDDFATGHTKIFLKEAASQMLEEARAHIENKEVTRIQSIMRQSSVRIQSTEHKAAIQALQKAITARDENMLASALKGFDGLPYGGGHLKEYTDATQLQNRLGEERKCLTKLEAALKIPGDLASLQAAVRYAGFLSPPYDTPQLAKATQLLTAAHGLLHSLQEAIDEKDIAEIRALLEECREKQLEGEAVVAEAKKCGFQLDKESAVREELWDAMQTKGIRQLSRLVEALQSCDKLGLQHLPQYAQAMELKAKIDAQNSCKHTLKKAVADAMASRDPTQLHAAYNDAVRAQVPADEEEMAEASQLLVALRKEKMDSESSARDEEVRARQEEQRRRKAAEDTKMREEQVAEAEEAVKNAMQAKDTAQLQASLDSASSIELSAQHSHTIKQGQACLTEWLTQEKFESDVKALETKLRHALDVHDHDALKQGLAEASELGLGEENTLVREAREKNAQWDEEASQMRSKAAQRMDMVKLLKGAVEKKGVTVAQVEEAQRRVPHCKSWLKEAAKWEPIIAGRSTQIKQMRSAALEGGVLLQSLEAAVTALEKDMRWLTDCPEVTRWRAQLKHRCDDVALVRKGSETTRETKEAPKRGLGLSKKAPKQAEADLSGVASAVVEDAIDALERIREWLTGNEVETWQAKLDNRSTTVRQLRAALASNGVPAATVEGASGLVQVASVWLQEAETWRKQISVRLEQMELFERAAMFDALPWAQLEQAAAMLKDGSFKWMSDSEANHWRTEVGRRAQVAELVNKGLVFDVQVTAVAAALTAVDRAALWLVEAPEWKTTLEGRQEQIELIKLAALGTKGNDVQADMITKTAALIEELDSAAAAFEGDPSEGGAWLHVPDDWKSAARRRFDVVQTLKAAAFGKDEALSSVLDAEEMLRQGEEWLVEAGEGMWGSQIKERVASIRIIGAGLKRADVTLVQLEHANAEIKQAIWLQGALQPADEETESMQDKLALRLELVGLCKRAASTMTTASETDVMNAYEKVQVNEAMDWCAPFEMSQVGWLTVIKERHDELVLMKRAVADEGVNGADVLAATVKAGPLASVQQWLAGPDALAWHEMLTRRRAVVATLNKAMGIDIEGDLGKQTKVPASDVDAAATLLDGGTGCSWFADAADLAPEIKQRAEDLAHLRLACATKEALPAAQIDSAGWAMERCAAWLEEATEWEEELTKRAAICKQLKLLAEGDENSVRMQDFVDAEEAGVLSQPHTWLKESSEWKAALKMRKKHAESIQRAATKSDIPSAYIEMAKVEILPEVRGWLAEAEEWAVQLEERAANVETLLAALADKRVTVAEVEQGETVLPGLLQWLSDAPSMEEKMRYRAETVRKLQAVATEPHSVLAEKVQFAHSALTGGKGAFAWLALDEEGGAGELRSQLETRVQACNQLRDAACKNGVTSESIEVAHGVLVDAAWLAEAEASEGGDGEWLTKINERLAVVKTLKASMAEEGVERHHVDRAFDELVPATKWLLDARTWRAELGRRVNVNKLISSTTQDRASVTLSMLNTASRHFDEGALDYLSGAEKDAFKHEVAKRQQDVEAVKLACGFKEVQARWVEEAEEPLSNLKQWMNDPQLRKWSSTMEKRIREVKLLQRALGKPGVNSNLSETNLDDTMDTPIPAAILFEAKKMVISVKSYLAEAPEWEGLVQARVSDMQHVKAVAESTKAVPMAMVEAVQEPAEHCQQYNLLEANAWCKVAFDKLETVELLKSALLEDQVSHTSVEEAVRAAEGATGWLVEAPQMKADLGRRMDLLRKMKMALMEHNVSAEQVTAALSLTVEPVHGGGCPLSWLDENDLEEWRGLVEERDECISQLKRAVGTQSVESTEVEAACEVIIACHWLADPEASQWRGQIEERMSILKLVQAALADSVSSLQLDAGIEALESIYSDPNSMALGGAGSAGTGWLMEGAEWHEQLSGRVKLMGELRNAATASCVPTETILKAQEDCRVAHWLQETAGWANLISERSDVINIVRDNVIDNTAVAPGQVEVALNHVERSMDWLAEAPTWKAVLQRRLEEMEMVKAALAEVKVTPSMVEKAVPVMQDIEPWFGDAPSWNTQLQERLKHLLTIRSAAADNTCVDSAVVEEASELEWALAWLEDEYEWKPRLRERMLKIKTLKAAVSRDSTMTAAMVEQALVVVDECKDWLAEAGRWRTVLVRRKAAIELLQRAVERENVPAAVVIKAASELESACSWLSDAVGWKATIGRRHHVVTKLKSAIVGTNVLSTSVETAMKLVDESLTWLEGAAVFKKEVERRLALVKYARGGVANANVTASSVEAARVAIKYLSWLSEYGDWEPTINKRAAVITSIHDTVAEAEHSQSQAGASDQAKSQAAAGMGEAKQALQRLVQANRIWLSVSPTGVINAGKPTPLEPWLAQPAGDVSGLVQEYKIGSDGNLVLCEKSDASFTQVVAAACAPCAAMLLVCLQYATLHSKWLSSSRSTSHLLAPSHPPSLVLWCRPVHG